MENAQFKQPYQTFIHPQIGKGRGTIAVRVSNNVVELGVSLCSKHDQFSRKIGRERATQQLDTKGAFYWKFNRDGARPLKEQAFDA